MANETRLETGVDLRGNKAINMATPIASTDGVNKAYALSLLAGGAIYDGGTASTSMSGVFKIDFGSAS